MYCKYWWSFRNGIFAARKIITVIQIRICPFVTGRMRKLKYKHPFFRKFCPNFICFYWKYVSSCYLSLSLKASESNFCMWNVFKQLIFLWSNSAYVEFIFTYRELHVSLNWIVVIMKRNQLLLLFSPDIPNILLGGQNAGFSLAFFFDSS